VSPPVEGRRPRLELVLSPEWGTIKDTWDTCLAHLAAQGLDEDTAYSLGMVAQELLENAVKYGAFSPGRDRIHFAISGQVESLVIEVRTPLGDPSGLERLDGMVQWIRGFQNPFEAFVERLKEIAARPYAHPESGLGLVRVAYEGQCLLDFYVDDGDVLAMSAVYHPPPRAPGRGHDAA
jgi:hypothetical protein